MQLLNSANGLYLLISILITFLSQIERPNTRISSNELIWILSILFSLIYPFFHYFFYNELQGEISFSLDVFDLISALLLAVVLTSTSHQKKYFFFSSFIPIALLIFATTFLPQEKLGLNSFIISTAMICATYICLSVQAISESKNKNETRWSLISISIICVFASIIKLSLVFITLSNFSDLIRIKIFSQTFYICWLSAKILLIHQVFIFLRLKKVENLTKKSSNFIKYINEHIKNNQITAQALFKEKITLLIIDNSFRIIFENEEAQNIFNKKIQINNNLNDLFFQFEKKDESSYLAFYINTNNEMILFDIDVSTFKFSSEQFKLLKLKQKEFNLDDLQKILIKNNIKKDKRIIGILDRQFSILNFNKNWSNLIGDIDSFSETGNFLDKLKLLSDENSEISYLENSLANESEKKIWINTRLKNTLAIKISRVNIKKQKRVFLVEINEIKKPESDSKSQTTEFHSKNNEEKRRNLIFLTVDANKIKKTRKGHNLEISVLAMISGLSEIKIKNLEEKGLGEFFEFDQKIDSAKRLANAMGYDNNFFLKNLKNKSFKNFLEKDSNSNLLKNHFDNLAINELSVLKDQTFKYPDLDEKFISENNFNLLILNPFIVTLIGLVLIFLNYI